MEEDMKKIQWKKLAIPWKYVLLGVLVSLLAGVLGELAFNWQGLTNPDKKGSIRIASEDMKVKGGEIKDGMFFSNGKDMTLQMKFSGQYVNKLSYTYLSPYVNVTADVVIHKKDGYGQDTIKVYTDKNSVLRDFSVVTVNSVVDEVELKFKTPTDGMAITSVSISDEPSYSKMRFLFFAMSAFLFYLLLVCRKTLEFHLERIFLLIALPAGLLMILGFSPREAGWDEHIHFYRAYSLIYDVMGKDTMPVADNMYVYMNTGMANEPFYFPQSQEENAQERAYGEVGRAEAGENPAVYQETNGIHIYSLAYLPQTLFLAAGLLLHVPFWLLIAMGRAGNLIFYCLLCYLAIRHMKRGKGLLTVIALFPTSVFLAATFSYDAFINGCMLLGMSYLFTELEEKDRPVSVKNLAVFVSAVILGSMPKAVYIPLILLGFLLPAKRFENKKIFWGYRGILLVSCLALMATFVMPTAGGNAEAASDPRGGDTSAGRQLALIFSHPVTYAGLLLRSIWQNLGDYLFGRAVAGNLAYRGVVNCGSLMSPFVIFTVFTDNMASDGQKSLGKWQKAFTAALLFGVISLIWTALYLSFTPVGLNQINGVQADITFRCCCLYI